MVLSPKLLAAIVLLFLLGSNEMRVAVARECQSPSHRFKGPCARDANCASVCQTEGFSDGKCARCFCVKKWKIANG
ncbi:hypothetical protein C2845_PM03G24440 [Panicum miliaceum]|uniref:Knottins-like domain-containing protein n=1 Tax=Panicum miliaceum TaxID=4540 RepID=A0A3L6T3P1_PANMI|nr:hypothetical protein C2845_PM03G24440 [Panicum miliaceum]